MHAWHVGLAQVTAVSQLPVLELHDVHLSAQAVPAAWFCTHCPLSQPGSVHGPFVSTQRESVALLSRLVQFPVVVLQV